MLVGKVGPYVRAHTSLVPPPIRLVDYLLAFVFIAPFRYTHE